MPDKTTEPSHFAHVDYTEGGDGLNLMFGILRKCVTVSFVLFDLVARMPVPKMVKNGFNSPFVIWG